MVKKANPNKAINKKIGIAQMITNNNILPKPIPPEGLYLLGMIIQARI